MRAIKIRAAKEDRELKDVVADLLRSTLAEADDGPPAIRHRLQLPLIQGGRPAPLGEELTPERLKQILLDQETEDHLDSPR